MHRFPSASALIGAQKPDRPVIGLRPQAAGKAARWFLENFPGDVAYAYKANSSVFLLGALYGAGIRHFDVASLPEIEDAATIPGAQLHFMHPVKSARRHPAGVRRVRRAQLRARQRGRAEEDPGGDRRLPRSHPVGARGRVGQEQQDPAGAQVRRLRRQGRAPAGQGAAGGQGARHHLPRRLADRDARRLRDGSGRGRPADRQGRRGARSPGCGRRLSVDLCRRRSGTALPSCAPSTTASSGCRSASAAS